MSDRSDIEWTDATWTPVRGCTKVSPGCKHCYAETFSERFRGVPGHPFEQGFDLRLVPDALDLPRPWRAGRLVFVNSMSMRSVETILGTMRTPSAGEVILVRRQGMVAASLDVAQRSARAAAAEPWVARSTSTRVSMLLSRDEYHALKQAGAVVKDPTLG